MWESNATGNVIVNSTDCSYLGKNGNRVYQELSGCPADISLPIEASTQSDGSLQCGIHVQNTCFGDELMTATRGTQPSLISNVTIALLEDLGYKVDYSQAATYTRDDLAAFCVCDGNDGSTRMLQEQKEESPPLERPPISDRGRLMAIEYAQKELKRMNQIAASYMMKSNATVAVPGMTVMFVDSDGVAQSMYVRNKWA